MEYQNFIGQYKRTSMSQILNLTQLICTLIPHQDGYI